MKQREVTTKNGVMFQNLAGVLLAVTMISCSVIKPPQFAGIERVEVDAIGEDSTSLAVSIALYNPNRVGATLERAYYDVLLDGELAGKGTWTGYTEIAARDTIRLTLPLVLRDSYLPVWERAVLGADSVNVTAPVKLELSTGIGQLEQEFELDVILPFKQMVRDWASEQVDRAGIEIERVGLRKLGVQEQELTVRIGFINPFDADLTVDSLDLDLFINDSMTGEIHSHEMLHLVPLSPIHTDLKLRVGSLKLGSSVISGVLNRGWEWRVEGTAHLVFRELKITVPVEDRGEIVRY